MISVAIPVVLSSSWHHASEQRQALRSLALLPDVGHLSRPGVISADRKRLNHIVLPQLT